MDGIYIGIYLILQILLGLYLSRFVKSEGDFFLGGRKLPTYAIAFSIFATWFGAETCIGSSAAVFSNGLSGSKAEPIGYGLCLFLTAFLIAPRLWNKRYTTLGDFFKDRFSGSTEKLAIWILIPSSLIWAAAQVRAFGQVISATTTLDVSTGITIATAFVIIYTLLGGLLGDIVTDVIQGIILIIGLVLIFILAGNDLGGIFIGLQAIPLEKLTFVSANESFWDRIDSWMIPIFGSLVAQELIARVLSAKNTDQAVKASYGGTFLYLFFGSIPILLGLLGGQFNLNLTDSEQFLPMLAKETLPSWLYIIFAGALVSAILSTIDSILLAISALISHNFVVPTFGITGPESKLRCARVVLIISGLFAYVMAIYGESVYDMVELASSFGTTGILIITLGGLYFKKATTLAANVALMSGLLLSILFEFFVKIPSYFTLSIFLVLGIFIAVSVLIKEPKRKIVLE